MTFAALAAERGRQGARHRFGTVAKSGIIDATVADAAFALKAGEVSAPVQGQFGAVIVTALKIEPEVTKTLADVTPQLRNAITLDRAKSQVRDIHDKIEDDRAAAPRCKKPRRSKNCRWSHSTRSTGPAATRRASRSSTFLMGAEIIKAAFSTDVGVDNDPIEATAAMSGMTSPPSRPPTVVRSTRSKTRSSSIGAI